MQFRTVKQRAISSESIQEEVKGEQGKRVEAGCEGRKAHVLRVCMCMCVCVCVSVPPGLELGFLTVRKYVSKRERGREEEDREVKS